MRPHWEGGPVTEVEKLRDYFKPEYRACIEGATTLEQAADRLKSKFGILPGEFATKLKNARAAYSMKEKDTLSGSIVSD